MTPQIEFSTTNYTNQHEFFIKLFWMIIFSCVSCVSWLNLFIGNRLWTQVYKSQKIFVLSGFRSCFKINPPIFRRKASRRDDSFGRKSMQRITASRKDASRRIPMGCGDREEASFSTERIIPTGCFKSMRHPTFRIPSPMLSMSIEVADVGDVEKTSNF